MDVKRWVQKMYNFTNGSLSTDNVEISVENNGPALTVEVSASNDGEKSCCNNKTHEKRKYFYADFTLGLHCKTWPKRAKGSKL